MPLNRLYQSTRNIDTSPDFATIVLPATPSTLSFWAAARYSSHVRRDGDPGLREQVLAVVHDDRAGVEARDQVQRRPAERLLLRVEVARVLERAGGEVLREAIARRQLLDQRVERHEVATADELGDREAEHRDGVVVAFLELDALGQLLVQRPHCERRHLDVDAECLLHVGDLVLDAELRALCRNQQIDRAAGQALCHAQIRRVRLVGRHEHAGDACCTDAECRSSLDEFPAAQGAGRECVGEAWVAMEVVHSSLRWDEISWRTSSSATATVLERACRLSLPPSRWCRGTGGVLRLHRVRCGRSIRGIPRRRRGHRRCR